MQKLRSIQVLRGIAASAVVVHHAYHYVNPDSFARIGAAGVDLFFVISGFIMATLGPSRSPAEFIVDRIWRIFPMWLLCVTPWLIIGNYGSADILTSLTLWPVWHGQFHTPIVLRGWTLCFEMLFYWCFALALATRAIIPLSIFAACLLVGPRNSTLYFVGSPLILEFLAGAAIARVPLHRAGSYLIPAGLFWLMAAPLSYYAELGGPGAFARFLCWGVPAAMIVYGARCCETLFEHQAFAFPLLVGNVSFSIYLFHRIALGGRLPWPIEAMGGVAAGICVYWLIERRILKLKPGKHLFKADPLALAAERGAG